MGEKNTRRMAQALGITISQLSEIENGKKKDYPDIEFLLRCIDFFGWKILENDTAEIKRDKIEKIFELFKKD